MIGLRANSAKIKACLRISRGKKTQAGFWLQYNGCAPEVSLARMEWRSCLDAGRRCLDTRQGEVRQLHIHLRVKSSPLGRGLGWQRWCWMLVQCPAKLRAWVVNTSGAEGCSLTQRPRASCAVPSHWLTWCPWDRLAASRPNGLTPPLAALLLVEQRAAQRLGNLCHHPPPAPWFHLL